MDRLETRMDGGFGEMRREFTTVRSEARADFRLLLGALVTVMFVAMILGFAAVIAAAD